MVAKKAFFFSLISILLVILFSVIIDISLNNFKLSEVDSIQDKVDFMGNYYSLLKENYLEMILLSSSRAAFESMSNFSYTEGIYFPEYTYDSFAGQFATMNLLNISLVEFWSFDNNFTGDYFGFKNKSVYGGPYINDSNYKNALVFDGVSYVNYGSFDVNEMNTISFWLKYNKGNKTQEIISKSSSDYGIDLSIKGDELFYSLKGNSNVYNLSKKLSEDKWYFISASYNSSNKWMYLYVDGDLVSSRSYGYLYDSFTNDLIFGSWNDLGDLRLFNGSIDEVSIWNRTLSAEELKYLYSAYKYNDVSFKNSFLSLLETGTFSLVSDRKFITCKDCSDIMINKSLTNYLDVLKIESFDLIFHSGSFKLNPNYASVNLFQDDPWGVQVSLPFNIIYNSGDDFVFKDENYYVKTFVPIIGIDDPYFVKDAKLSKRKFNYYLKKQPNSLNLNLSELNRSINDGLYFKKSDGLSFIERFFGNETSYFDIDIHSKLISLVDPWWNKSDYLSNEVIMNSKYGVKSFIDVDFFNDTFKDCKDQIADNLKLYFVENITNSSSTFAYRLDLETLSYILGNNLDMNTKVLCGDGVLESS